MALENSWFCRMFRIFSSWVAVPNFPKICDEKTTLRKICSLTYASSRFVYIRFSFLQFAFRVLCPRFIKLCSFVTTSRIYNLESHIDCLFKK